MSQSTPPPGTIVWHDLTVPNTEAVRAFYEAVVGWKPAPVEMGGYADHAMLPRGKRKAVAGICHARGVNAGLPPQWLAYITVADLAKSLRACRARGGKVVRQPRDLGDYGRYAVIQDPAGAVAALIQPPRQR